MITLREEEWGLDCECQVWGHISAVVKMFYLLIYVELSSVVSFLLNSKLYTTFYVCVNIYICIYVYMYTYVYIYIYLQNEAFQNEKQGGQNSTFIHDKITDTRLGPQF